MKHCGLLLSVVCILSQSAPAVELWGLSRGTPEIASADVLTFGPEDILFIGDNKSAAIFAVATGDKEGTPATSDINIEDVAAKIGDVAGGKAVIRDLVANPATGNVFIAAAVDGKAALLKIDGAGKISAVPLQDIRFAKAALKDAPEDKVTGNGGRQRNLREQTITDLAFYEGKVLVSGLRSSDSPSSVRELSFPFAVNDKGVSVEIYHAAHGRDEDYAAARTIVPMNIDGEPSLLAAYVCTPLVKIPLKDVDAGGDKVRATTVAELGNRNQPLDMVSYTRDGKTFLLLSNSARGVMKITTAGLSSNAGLTEPVRGGGTAGQSYETIKSMEGVVQMDKLNDDHAVILVQTDNGIQNLRTVALP
ncbi:MAG: hypothetical protein KDA89_02940 [Planctomycetaceae bacterium]|nr:hypothetical protein [Planctomycetaceae bacterium]